MPEREKPIGGKVYTSIGHLPGSKTGDGDYCVNDAVARRLTTECHPGDRVIVQEKVDGCCMAAARLGDDIIPLTRIGYRAADSIYENQRMFAVWAAHQEERFRGALRDGERLCGEWLPQAHGTRYQLAHEPFVAFDIMAGGERLPFDDFRERVSRSDLTIPHVLQDGGAFGIESAMSALGEHGFHGALERPEGAVWRLEVRKSGRFIVGQVAKYVRPDMEVGRYLPRITNGAEVWNWRPPSASPV